MDKQEYSQEQIADITARQKEVIEFINSKQLSIAATISKVRVGDDIFADKVSPVLIDTKYTPVKSPFVENGGEGIKA